MPDPFVNTSFINLECYDGNNYKLFKTTWDIKLAHPERAHIQHNFHKIVETLKLPDEVRASEENEKCFIAYKKFDFYWVLPNVSPPIHLE